MSKSVKLDHDFNIDLYVELLAQAQGGRSQTEFAKDCGLSVAYVCKYLNKKFDKPPVPSTIKKIAAVAANNVTYAALLEAAGYDSSKYATPTNDGDSNFDSVIFKKLATATITSALSSTNLKWSVAHNPNSKNFYDLDVVLNSDEKSHWYFSFLTSVPKFVQNSSSGFLNRIFFYYGQMVTMTPDIVNKFSFVTDSENIYDSLISNAPLALVMPASVILIDTNLLSVIREDQLKTAYNNSMNSLFNL